MDRIKNKIDFIHSDISEDIIGCCFEVMKELGPGFLENVYKNALFIAMKQKGLNVESLKDFIDWADFRDIKMGARWEKLEEIVFLLQNLSDDVALSNRTYKAKLQEIIQMCEKAKK